MYRVAKASEYVVVTGYGIRDVKLAKKAWILPGQSSTVIDITPVNYTFDVQAMSAEKLPFVLPAVFTIGPRSDDRESLERYAKLVAPHDKLSNHVKELVQGVIEGETRVLAAGMTMEEIFKGTKQFKKEVFEKVQLELDLFGLLIYNANVKQLVDVKGHEYFSYLGQKTQQEAANQAKVDVAEAKYKGDTGAKERSGLTLQNAAKVDAETRIFSKAQAGMARQQEAKIDADTRVYENEREAEMAKANAQLETRKAQWAQQAEIAQIEATKAAAIREAELQSEVEKGKAAAEKERLRASKLAEATVEYEAGVQEANAELYRRQKEAEGVLYAAEREAEARQKTADAEMYRKQREADAHLYARQKEAEGIRAMAQAQADYVSTMLAAFGGDRVGFHDYLMIDRRVYQEMGKINADAVQGLNPKISVWTTDSHSSSSASGGGGGGAAAGAGMQEMASIFKMIPPLFSTIKDQTGIAPLPWIAALPSHDPNDAKQVVAAS